MGQAQRGLVSTAIVILAFVAFLVVSLGSCFREPEAKHLTAGCGELLLLLAALLFVLFLVEK